MTEEATRNGASRRQRLIDHVLSLVILAFSGWVVWITQNQIPRGFRTDPLGPAAVPAMLAGTIAVLAVGLVLTRAFGMRWLKPSSVGEDEGFAETDGTFSTMRLYGLIALSFAYLFAMEPLGYVIASLAYGLAMLVLLGVRAPVRLLGIPIVFVAALYALFGLLLKVPLPQGPFTG